MFENFFNLSIEASSLLHFLNILEFTHILHYYCNIVQYFEEHQFLITKILNLKKKCAKNRKFSTKNCMHI